MGTVSREATASGSAHSGQVHPVGQVVEAGLRWGLQMGSMLTRTSRGPERSSGSPQQFHPPSCIERPGVPS